MSCAHNSSGTIVNQGPARPLTFVQMLDSEIIQVTDGVGNCFACVGGLTESQILSRLQTDFPDSDWDLDLLQRRLRAGTSQGRLCRPTPTTYSMRTDMAIVNYANSIFIPYSPNIIRPRGFLGTQASVNFVFVGNNPPNRNLSNLYHASAVSIIDSQLTTTAYLSGLRK